MQYMALIYWDEGAPENVPDDVIEQYGAFTREIIAAGVFKAGDALQGIETATSIRLRGGERRVTDGPFAETKEQLGGYYLLECDDLDQAIAWASKIPTASYGTIEVRPVRIYES